MTNLILSLLVSTNATLHWERSPDPSVTGYVMYASSVSRYTNERRAVQQTVPSLPGQQPLTLVTMRSYIIATNIHWHVTAASNVLGNVTNWTISVDNVPGYYAVLAVDSNGIPSELSNEVLFAPQWAFVNFCIEGSSDLRNWGVMGTTNVLRFWRGVNRTGNIPGFFRGRLVITNK